MDWGAIYVNYLQLLRKLEEVYDQMLHPQKRVHVREAVEVCAARMLEVRSWLVRPRHPPSNPLPAPARLSRLNCIRSCSVVHRKGVVKEH